MANEGAFAYDDSFSPAKSRKKRKNKPQSTLRSPVEQYEATLQQLLKDDGGAWMHNFEKQLLEVYEDRSPPKRILCLGLGSPTESVNARAQLVALVRLADALSLSRDNVIAYDPEFNGRDVDLLHHLGVQCKPKIFEADQQIISDPTLMYMIHCEHELYQAILANNWSPTKLRNLTIIGNDYGDIRTTQAPEAHRHLARILPYLRTHNIARCIPFLTAFSATSIQEFKESDTPGEADQFWSEFTIQPTSSTLKTNV